MEHIKRLKTLTSDYICGFYCTISYILSVTSRVWKQIKLTHLVLFRVVFIGLAVQSVNAGFFIPDLRTQKRKLQIQTLFSIAVAIPEKLFNQQTDDEK